MGGDAKRLQEGEVDDLGADRNGVAFHLVRGPGIVAQRRDHPVYIAPRLAERLAHVLGFDRRQLLASAADEVGKLEQSSSRNC